ncbi:N-acetyl sugar amidotransferase [Bacteriovoracales bacterium]|nr:N-acetyl sugar amidotransferase [Bacteriovoracales bacterium]
MFKFREVDYDKYKNDESREAYYGLPSEVKYCKKCVISNQRPNSTQEYKNKTGDKKTVINFDENGICDACNFAEIKHEKIDWDERERMLVDLCDKHRRNDGRYDCIVPGSGGKDSVYTSHLLKYKYGMNPLTVTWAPHMYTSWGWDNFQNWIHSGLDNHLHTPNGKVHRLLTRLAMETLFHPFQPFFFGQKSLAPKLADLFDIPLIFYGENEAEYGNKKESANSPLQENKYFALSNDDLYLSGVSMGELQEKYKITKNELLPYLPIDQNIVQEKNIEVHYFGYYKKWHPQSCYYYSVENANFVACPERNPGTYSKYASLDDKIDDYHFYTTFIKFGIGRCTHDASQEVRSRDITRDEAVSLVRRYDGEYPERFKKDIHQYLSLDKKDFGNITDLFESPEFTDKYFKNLVDYHRSPHIWRLKENDNWELRQSL